MTTHSDATLLSWLATKPERLEKHLDKHPEDIDRLDRLTALDDHQVVAIGQTVVPPDEFAEQVISRISLDPRLREAGSVFADMLTIGFRALQVVFGSADATDTDNDAGDDIQDIAEDTAHPPFGTEGPDR
jgi:uncharacterized protein YciI